MVEKIQKGVKRTLTFEKNGAFLSVELFMEIPIEGAHSVCADSFNTLYKEALNEIHFTSEVC